MQFCSLTDKAIPHRSKSLNLVPRREKGTLLQTLKHLEQKNSAHTKKRCDKNSQVYLKEHLRNC